MRAAFHSNLGMIIATAGLAFSEVRTACAQNYDFVFNLKNALEPHAEKYVVEKINIRTFHELFKPNYIYWAAAANDLPASLTFRFSLVKPMKSGRLLTSFVSANFDYDKKIGSGRGDGSLWCSRDGKNWILLMEAKAPIDRALYWKHYNALLPSELAGSRELWIQARLFATGMKDGTYGTAQFCRNSVGDPNSPVFDLRIKYDNSTTASVPIDQAGHLK